MGKGGDKKSLFNDTDRGTSDELEVLMMIIKENPSIRHRVLEKLRMAKNRAAVNQGKAGGPPPKD